MPTYEYECDACKHNFDEFQSFSDPPLRKWTATSERRMTAMMLDPKIASGFAERWCSGGGGGAAWVDPMKVVPAGTPRSRVGVAIGSIAAASVQGRPTDSAGGFGDAGAVISVAGGPRREATSATPSMALARRPRRSAR